MVNKISSPPSKKDFMPNHSLVYGITFELKNSESNEPSRYIRICVNSESVVTGFHCMEVYLYYVVVHKRIAGCSIDSPL